MPLPKSVKFKKNGVEFLSNCDRLEYTLKELIRAALRDTGKYVCREARKKVKRRTGRMAKNTQYWVRSKQQTPDLQVGFKPGGFYGIFQEIGTEKQPKIAALTSSAENNVAMIQKIQQQYLSAIGSESAEQMIDEGEYEGE
ncbi:MAG: HK97 gp10 family phage protein [Ruminococcus sp.]|nr:HK97 gp10 family phage protein [Ruminococcus sp.]